MLWQAWFTCLWDSVRCWLLPPASEPEAPPTVSQQRVWPLSLLWSSSPASRCSVCPSAWFSSDTESWRGKKNVELTLNHVTNTTAHKWVTAASKQTCLRLTSERLENRQHVKCVSHHPCSCWVTGEHLALKNWSTSYQNRWCGSKLCVTSLSSFQTRFAAPVWCMWVWCGECVCVESSSVTGWNNKVDSLQQLFQFSMCFEY